MSATFRATIFYKMIKTWLKDALRNIKRRFVSWLSIVTIVFIGTTLILGLFFASSTVKKASSAYIEGQNFMDFDVSGSMGIKEEEIARIKELDQVNDAEGQISFYGVANYDKNSTGVTVISTTERISIPTVMEGGLPSADDECAVSFSALGKLGASIGDKIEINVSSARFADVLPNTRYKVTGIASHPDYMTNISTDYIVLPSSCFDTSGMAFDYSHILVDADIDIDTFTGDYKKRSTEIADILEKETDSMAGVRIEKISKELDDEYANAVKKADEELAKGKSELDDAVKLFNETLSTAKEQLAQGEEELNGLKEKAEKELNEARRKIKEGEEEYNRSVADGQKQLEDAEKQMQQELENAQFQLFAGFLQIDEAEKQLQEKEKEFERYQTIYVAAAAAVRAADGNVDIGSSEYNDIISQLGYSGYGNGDVYSALDAFKAELDEKRKLLDQGWYSLEQAKQKLADGQAEYARKEPEAKKQLEDARNEFEEKKAEGAKQLEDARKTLGSKEKEASETLKNLEAEFLKAQEEYNSQKESGEKELGEANTKYEEAKSEAEDKLSEMKSQIDAAKDTPCAYMVRTRDVNFPFVQTRSYIKSINGFFSAFTPLYAGIIAVVCFFTMTIIIEEQTSQIGTCKAFGMYESEIMRKYIVFGASGALFGALAGVVGAFVIEKALINTMKDNMAFSLSGTGHNVFMIILLPVVEVLITVIAVLWSCHRYIKCSAVGLISGSEPAARYRKKAGKPLSKSLYTNLIINNLFTDIGREVVSVVTIVMCVFIVGFGIDIKLSYEGALKRQMNDIWKFDITLTESGKITDEEREVVRQALADYDTLYLPITVGVINIGDSQVLTNIICVDDKDEFGRFYVLKDPYGKDVSVFDDGVLVTKEMEDKNGLGAGTNVQLISGNFKYSEADVKGVFMLYAGKTMIMTRDYFSEHLGFDQEPNTYYIKISGTDPKILKEQLSELPGVSQVELTKDLRDRNMAVVNLYNAVVVIVIMFSVLLSFMILLNLSNILVAHRMRELLTMRVNGFSNMHVIGYLVREVLIIGLLSIVIALSLGVPLTGVIIKNLETDAFMFVRTPFALAWAASVMINVLFSFTINLIAFRKVNKVPLTDINKY